MGSDPEQVARAAALLDQRDCLGIDINMGCSAPLIRKTGAGAAWMASPDRAGELMGLVRKGVKKRLSVKLRTGFDDDFDYLVRFCRRLEAEGTELITLHPRTVREKFKRSAKWDYVGALKKELHRPVEVIGDLASAEVLLRRGGSGCDAVMVGRGAVRAPWIFAEARKIEISAKVKTEEITAESAEGAEVEYTKLERVSGTGLRFLELLRVYQPPEFWVSRARRFFGFFCDNLKWGNYLKNLLNREGDLEGIERVWVEFFKI
jgi:tRNA-dihydrouridine synthase